MIWWLTWKKYTDQEMQCKAWFTLVWQLSAFRAAYLFQWLSYPQKGGERRPWPVFKIALSGLECTKTWDFCWWIRLSLKINLGIFSKEQHISLLCVILREFPTPNEVSNSSINNSLSLRSHLYNMCICVLCPHAAGTAASSFQWAVVPTRNIEERSHNSFLKTGGTKLHGPAAPCGLAQN